MSKRKVRLRIIQYTFSVIVTLGILAPVVWMILTSLMYPKDLTALPLKLIPDHITFSRYQELFTDTNIDGASYIFRAALLNSVIVAAFVTAFSLVVGSLAAYGFARLSFRFKNGLMMLTLFTYMIPPVALVIPMYMIFSQFNLLDNKSALIVLYLSFIIPFIIWVMQGFFGSISKSYEEAAEIDGASRLQTLIYVFAPIARPGATPDSQNQSSAP